MYDRNPGEILDYHRSMLADHHRTLSLKKALNDAIRPGDVVLDLGCGSGILTCFACRAGARRVYAVEVGSVIELARSLCRANHCEQQVVFLHDLSSHVNLPEKVDVVVSETIGNFGLDEGILEWMIDGRTRFLAPGGRMIPEALELFVVPIEKAEIASAVSDWDAASGDLDLDLRTGRKLGANNLLFTQLLPQDLLGTPAGILSLDLRTVTSASASGSARIQITRSGVVHGIGGWFNARLSSDIFLSNAPPNTAPSWSHVVFPMEATFGVEPGDELLVEIHCFSNGSMWSWQVEHQPVSGPKIRYPKQSTFAGQLLSHEFVLRQAAEHRPGINSDGEHALRILNALDGSRSLIELAAHLVAADPRRFPTQDEALHFVRRVCAPYGR